jgi:hypothetical protein
MVDRFIEGLLTGVAGLPLVVVLPAMERHDLQRLDL